MRKQRNPEELEPLIAQLIAAQSDEEAYDIGAKIHEIGRPALSRAIELTQDSRPFVREWAAFLLGQLPDYEAKGYTNVRDGIPTLLALLEHDSEEKVRIGALYALAHLSAIEATPLILPYIENPDKDIRYAAAFALGSFGGDEEDSQMKSASRAGLLRLANDSDSDVRDWATFGLHLSDHDTPEVRSQFWKALDDPEPDVRGEAAEGLAQFGDRTFIPRLAQLLRENDVMGYYFNAAELFADPVLLPDVEIAAERWHNLPDDQKGYYSSRITSALEILRALAAESAGNQSPLE